MPRLVTQGLEHRPRFPAALRMIADPERDELPGGHGEQHSQERQHDRQQRERELAAGARDRTQMRAVGTSVRMTARGTRPSCWAIAVRILSMSWLAISDLSPENGHRPAV